MHVEIRWMILNLELVIMSTNLAYPLSIWEIYACALCVFKWAQAFNIQKGCEFSWWPVKFWSPIVSKSWPFWTALMLCYIWEGVDWTTYSWRTYKSQTICRPLISNCPSIKKGGDFIHEPSFATVDLSLHTSNIPIITTKSNCWVHACYQSNQTPPILTHQFNLSLTQ